MLEPFVSPKLLLVRAREHLAEFETVERNYVKKRPYSLFKEQDSETGNILCKARVKFPPPPPMAAIAFDIVNELRSALDHAVFDGSVAIGGEPTPKYTKFPFGLTPEEAANDLPRKHSEVPEAIRPFLLGFEPYKGGKHSLWELNELRNGKIHRTLTAVVIASGGVDMRDGTITNAVLDVISEWDPAKNELTYMRIRPGAEMNMHMDIAVQVAFSEGTVFGNKHAFAVFRDLTKVVDGIVKGIEAEAARLKAARLKAGG